MTLDQFVDNIPDIFSLDTETTGLDVFEDGFNILGTSMAYRYLPDIYSIRNLCLLEREALKIHSPLFFGVSLFNQKVEDMYWGVNSCYIFIGDKKNNLPQNVFSISSEEAKELFQKVLHSGKTIIMHNAKYDLKVIEKLFNVRVEKNIEDTMLMSYLLDETLKAKHNLKFLSEKYLIPIEHFAGELFIAMAISDTAKYAKNDAIATLRLREKFIKRVEAEKLTGVFNLEMKNMYIAKDMEMNGLLIDEEHLKYLEEETQKRLSLLQEEIFNLAGRKFLISSSQQVAQVLFNEMKIEYNKEKVGKSGVPSTSASALEELKGTPIIDKILKYREYIKLQGTFLHAFRHKRSKDGRIRASFRQFNTETGRFACADPNIQQIAKKLDDLEIRRCFIAGKGKKFIYFDLSQIELRMTAHFSGDTNMISAYVEGRDLHRETAAKIKKLEEGEESLLLTQEDLDNVTSDERSASKAISFGVIYGRGAKSISETLQISIDKAEKLIEGYFNVYPAIRELEVDCFNKVSNYGFIRTISGRKRRFDLKGKNRMEIARIRRQGLNTLIQSSSADIFKLIMSLIQDRFQNGEVKMLAQIHDATMLEVDENMAESLVAIIKDIAENPLKKTKLNIPLVVDIEIIDHWH